MTKGRGGASAGVAGHDGGGRQGGARPPGWWHGATRPVPDTTAGVHSAVSARGVHSAVWALGEPYAGRQGFWRPGPAPGSAVLVTSHKDTT